MRHLKLRTYQLTKYATERYPGPPPILACFRFLVGGKTRIGLLFPHQRLTVPSTTKTGNRSSRVSKSLKIVSATLRKSLAKRTAKILTRRTGWPGRGTGELSLFYTPTSSGKSPWHSDRHPPFTFTLVGWALVCLANNASSGNP